MHKILSRSTKCSFVEYEKLPALFLCVLNLKGSKEIHFASPPPLKDPYVKVSLICDGRRLKKRKTTTKKNTLNPVYNEAIIFDIPPENVEQVSLSITVMDYDRSAPAS